MREIELDKWFHPKDKGNDILFGVELELLLFDARQKEPLQNMGLCERILENIDKQIYRDYYPYQLELRTKPHDNPEDTLKEMKDLYKKASKAFIKHDIYVVPVPAIVRSGYVYCGLHTHISYPKEKTSKNYFNRAMGMYPFILSLADHSKNFEVAEMEMSDRLDKSNHIGLPYLDAKQFLSGNPGNHKYKDIILSLPIDDDHNRSRMKKPTTIEVRILDTPSLYGFFEFNVRYLMALAKYIKDDNPMLEMLRLDNREVSNRLSMTRNLIVKQRYGINKIFRMANMDVCETISDYFNIKFPEETQFEFRERNNFSGDVNGFLSMSTKGGWL